MKSHIKNILVVDDDTTLIGILKTQLEKQGFKIHLAQNGKAALQCLPEFTPDLLVTDIYMDEMDGIELMVHFKKVHPDVKIIAISGHPESLPMSFLIMARALGANRTLAKPFDLPTLTKLIHELDAEGGANGSAEA